MMFTRKAFLFGNPGRVVGLLAISLQAATACAPATSSISHQERSASAVRSHPYHDHAEDGVKGATPSTREHPHPRTEATPERVADPEQFTDEKKNARVSSVYLMAREIPHVVDGLYCYCDCSRHHQHYSLLTCFESDHGAKCMVCLDTVELAYQLHQEGKNLEEIRAAVDAKFAG
jgi:hypothetical protein